VGLGMEVDNETKNIKQCAYKTHLKEHHNWIVVYIVSRHQWNTC
jgi:hypothetical protein